MQNPRVAGVKRDGLIQVRPRPHKVEPVDGAQEAASGVARGLFGSERDRLLCSRKCTIQFDL